MKQNPDKLERLIHDTLRSLPNHSAPRSLESRVLAAIAERAALTWWRKSFTHWPMAARLVFLVAGAALLKVALMATIWVLAGFDASEFANAFSTQFAWIQHLNTAIRALASYGMLLFRSIPTIWLYVIAAGFAATYAILLGLGATAYRTLMADR